LIEEGGEKRKENTAKLPFTCPQSPTRGHEYENVDYQKHFARVYSHECLQNVGAIESHFVH